MRQSILIALCFTYFFAHSQLQSPEIFLPTSYGNSFTPHHEVVNYIYHVAKESKYIKVVEYGRTYEDRPLLLCFVSTPENLANLENIRQAHMSDLGFSAPSSTTVTDKKAIVWLSFSVHGNEASGTESSMKSLYTLASASSDTILSYLKNTIYIIDPCLNPDGFARYTNWVRGIEKNRTYPDLDDEEHHEPWPGGRVNHYQFDLNRDWAWQTQTETKQRLKVYNEWMPHVHADFHEMGFEDNYYFPPAAKPYHEYLTDFQRTFQSEFGKNHAKYFDANDWLYFTSEAFDLFYPSYGDTYPMFSGAIGMTYEQAGLGRAGRAVQLKNGDTLTLKDRILHHYTVALSTVEVSAKNYKKLVDNQIKYFADSKQKPKGQFKSIVLKKGPHQNALLRLLDINKIAYSKSGTSKKLTGISFATNEQKSISIDAGDVVVSAFQPRSVLMQTLLEPDHFLEDSLTYDITAWSLPLAYGVEAYGLSVDPLLSPIPTSSDSMKITAQACAFGATALALPWKELHDAQILSKLFDAGVKIHVTDKSVQFGNNTFEAGTHFVFRKGQADWKKTIDQITKLTHYTCVESGFSEHANDFGGNSFTMMTPPKVITVRGEEIASSEFGQIMYYFEQVLDYPVTTVSFDRLSKIDLDKYNTLIMPGYDYSLEGALGKKLSSWVNSGGKLIVLASGCGPFAASEDFGLDPAEEDQQKMKDDSIKEEAIPYADRYRSSLSHTLSGAILKSSIDNTHPYGWGMGQSYFTLKTEDAIYQSPKDGWFVSKINSPLFYKGFIGKNLRDKLGNTPVVSVEDKGRGSVVYLPDNPLYRGFWINGQFLFSNVLFH